LIRNKHSRSWFGYIIAPTGNLACHSSGLAIGARCGLVTTYLAYSTSIALLFISVMMVVSRSDKHTALGSDLLKAVDSFSESVILTRITFNLANNQ